MKHSRHTFNFLLATALLAGGLDSAFAGKSYSGGGGHSYSSHSSSSGGSHSFSSGSHSFSSGSSSHSSSSTHSSSGGSSTHTYSSGGSSSHSSSSGSTSTHSSGGNSGGGSTHTYSSGSSSHPSSSSSSSSSSGSKSFSSGSGKSYSSKPTGSDSDRHSYTSGKSYSSGSSYDFVTGSAKSAEVGRRESESKAKTDPAPSTFSYDTAAARAKKQEVSKTEFTRFKESQAPPVIDSTRGSSSGKTYDAKPPPIAVSGGSYRTRTYIPDTVTIRTRPVRVYNVFNPYYTRPVVIYRDPYDSFFWWWLLDRSLDDRAWWAYHHRYDMDPARYEALMERDQQLEQRVAELEAQQVPRDPAYTPPGIDRDLMYSDNYVAQSYNNRPTRAGFIAFWVFAVPTAFAVLALFIWLIWFKRWQPATAIAT